MQELTAAQKEYFKDSKMVDTENNLQVFYHATNSDFDAFDKECIGCGHGASFGAGFYFASEPIPSYGKNIEVLLDVKQPYILDLNDKENILTFGKLNNISKKEMNNWIEYYGNAKSGISKALSEKYGDVPFLKNFIKNGYDGIIVLNASVGGYNNHEKQNLGKEVIVFEPNQIKSIDNLYPTKSDNFKDNSKEYFKEHQKGIDELLKDAEGKMEHGTKTTNAREYER